MIDTYGWYEHFEAPPITKPNRITGEGRGKYRPLSRHKVGDQKKKERRKMSRKSRRMNRR